MARIRFQVLVNGSPLCIAGGEDDGDVTVTAAHVYHRQPRTPLEALFNESRDIELCELRVEGTPLAGEPIEWLRRRLCPGDEITIRVLGSGAADPPPPHLAASAGDDGIPF